MEKKTLQVFEDAFLITKTGKDRAGNSYSAAGVLNQAAWIGENAGTLLEEIKRLQTENVDLKKRLRLFKATIDKIEDALVPIPSRMDEDSAKPQ